MVQLWSRRIRSTERLLEKVPSAEGPDDPGFVGLGPILEDPKHFRSDYVIKQKLQRMRWEEYIAKYGWGIQMIKLSDALPQIVRYGIPDELKSAPTGCFFLSNLSRCSVAHCAPPQLGRMQAGYGRYSWAASTATRSNPASINASSSSLKARTQKPFLRSKEYACTHNQFPSCECLHLINPCTDVGYQPKLPRASLFPERQGQGGAAQCSHCLLLA